MGDINREFLAQEIARVWDPVGWKWFDKAEDKEHADAKRLFLVDNMKRANAVIDALGFLEVKELVWRLAVKRQWPQSTFKSENTYGPPGSITALIGQDCQSQVVATYVPEEYSWISDPKTWPSDDSAS